MIFEQGEIIEAVEPSSRCWLTANFNRQISDGEFEIEWYDDVLRKSRPTPTERVTEIRKKHFRGSLDTLQEK